MDAPAADPARALYISVYAKFGLKFGKSTNEPTFQIWQYENQTSDIKKNELSIKISYK